MLFLMLLVVMLLTGCSGEPVVDLSPVSYGLSIVGIALVLSSLVNAISHHWPRDKSMRRREPR